MSPGGVFLKTLTFLKSSTPGERDFCNRQNFRGGSKNCLDSNLSSDMNNGITVGCILFLYPR